MGSSAERRIEFTSGALKLEGMMREGAGALAAVVLHPHPQYGGDMDNHVVASICATLGPTTLRFNTRGTGRSEGEYDDGRGERDDVVAAVATLREAVRGARLLLVDDVKPAGVVLVSPPTQNPRFGAFDANTPALLITGEHDTVSSPALLAPLASSHRTVVVVPDADHGWWPGIDRVCDEISTFIKTL